MDEFGASFLEPRCLHSLSKTHGVLPTRKRPAKAAFDSQKRTHLHLLEL